MSEAAAATLVTQCHKADLRRRARLRVAGNDSLGPYTLLRLERGGLAPGIPGQFFMLEAPGRLLPRPMSLCLAPAGELAFLMEPIGPGTSALCGLEPGDAIQVLGPLGNGFDLDVERPLLVGGGIGIAPLPYLAEPGRRGRAPRVSQRAARRGGPAASRRPGRRRAAARDRADPRGPGDVLACGPAPMLEAVRDLHPGAQLAWEAPMACGFGACYGCVVNVDGRYARLCIDGPVLR